EPPPPAAGASPVSSVVVGSSVGTCSMASVAMGGEEGTRDEGGGGKRPRERQATYQRSPRWARRCNYLLQFGLIASLRRESSRQKTPSAHRAAVISGRRLAAFSRRKSAE